MSHEIACRITKSLPVHLIAESIEMKRDDVSGMAGEPNGESKWRRVLNWEKHGQEIRNKEQCPQGLKPGVFLPGFAARLKSCPDTKLYPLVGFSEAGEADRDPDQLNESPSRYSFGAK
jgi:hypothetical protein